MEQRTIPATAKYKIPPLFMCLFSTPAQVQLSGGLILWDKRNNYQVPFIIRDWTGLRMLLTLPEQSLLGTPLSSIFPPFLPNPFKEELELFALS